MTIKSLIQKNSITYFTDFQGVRIIVMTARFESRNELPRLFKLAQDTANEIKMAMQLEQQAQKLAA